MYQETLIDRRLDELAYRSNHGVEVWLFWGRGDGDLSVVVVDDRTGETFQLTARPDNALDVFYHPYAYAAGAETEQ